MMMKGMRLSVAARANIAKTSKSHIKTSFNSTELNESMTQMRADFEPFPISFWWSVSWMEMANGIWKCINGIANVRYEYGLRCTGNQWILWNILRSLHMPSIVCVCVSFHFIFRLPRYCQHHHNHITNTYELLKQTLTQNAKWKICIWCVQKRARDGHGKTWWLRKEPKSFAPLRWCLPFLFQSFLLDSKIDDRRPAKRNNRFYLIIINWYFIMLSSWLAVDFRSTPYNGSAQWPSFKMIFQFILHTDFIVLIWRWRRDGSVSFFCFSNELCETGNNKRSNSNNADKKNSTKNYALKWLNWVMTRQRVKLRGRNSDAE